MEEEVQVSVQVWKWKEKSKVIGETHGKEQGEEQRSRREIIKRTIMDDHEYEVMRACKPILEPMQCDVNQLARVHCA